MREGSTIHPAVWILMALLAVSGAGGQDRERERAVTVKAGMVVNFVRYTTWPESSFADGQAPIVVTVVGDGPMAEALAAATRGQTVSGRRLEIRRAQHPASRAGQRGPSAEDVSAFRGELRASHAVYVGDAENERLGGLLEALRGADVLTVSSLPDFAERGGMLGFVLRQRRIAFDANEEAIKQTRLEVSSQVLKLARIVRQPAEKPEGKP